MGVGHAPCSLGSKCVKQGHAQRLSHKHGRTYKLGCVHMWEVSYACFGISHGGHLGCIKSIFSGVI